MKQELKDMKEQNDTKSGENKQEEIKDGKMGKRLSSAELLRIMKKKGHEILYSSKLEAFADEDMLRDPTESEKKLDDEQRLEFIARYRSILPQEENGLEDVYIDPYEKPR